MLHPVVLNIVCFYLSHMVGWYLPFLLKAGRCLPVVLSPWMLEGPLSGYPGMPSPLAELPLDMVWCLFFIVLLELRARGGLWHSCC